MRNYDYQHSARQMTDANSTAETEITPPHRPQPLGTPPKTSEASAEASDSVLRAGEAIPATQSEGGLSGELGGEAVTRSLDETPGHRTSPFVVTDESRESV